MQEQNIVNIFYEANHDLAPVLSASIVSVCENTSCDIHFYLLDTGLHNSDKLNLQKILSPYENKAISFIDVDLNQFKHLKGYRAENFVDCYSRLLIPNLEPSVDKAIYLDSDTIALTDIKELWDTDLCGKALAAPPDTGISHVILPHIANLGVDYTKQIYISAGVYIMDCKKWRSQTITEKLLSLAETEKNKIGIIIEDLFTMYFRENFKVIDPKWGFIEYSSEAAQYIPDQKITSDYLDKTRTRVAIIHFAGANKVWRTQKHWLSGKKILHFDEFWYYLSKTPYFYGMYISYTTAMATPQHIPESTAPIYIYLKLFNRIPFIKIRKNSTGIRYYLFNFIPIFKLTTK